MLIPQVALAWKRFRKDGILGGWGGEGELIRLTVFKGKDEDFGAVALVDI